MTADGVSFRVLAPAEHERWDEIAAGPGGHLRQATWWADPLVPYGMAFDVIGCFEAGELTGGALLRSARAPYLGVSLTDCLNGPVHPAWRPGLARPFLDAVAAVARRRRALQVTFRNVPDPAAHRTLADDLGRRRAVRILTPAPEEAVVALAGRTLEEITAGFDTNTRRSVRRGASGPLTVRALVDPDELAQAHRAFGATAERKGFEDLRPWAANEPLLRRAVATGRGATFGALAGDRVVGAIFVSFAGREAEYVYGGFHLDAVDLRPNHVLHRAAIEAAIERGCETYNLGLLRGGEVLGGVDRFKLGFGAQRHPLLDTIEWHTHPQLVRALTAVRSQGWGRRALRQVRRRVVRRGDGRSAGG